MCHFVPCKNPDAVLTIRKNVCMFNHTVNYRFCVSLQRLFQRKDLCPQILNELVVLSDDQLNKLRDSHDLLLESIKNKLLTYTLTGCVLNEMNKHPDDGLWNLYDSETPDGVEEFTDALSAEGFQVRIPMPLKIDPPCMGPFARSGQVLSPLCGAEFRESTLHLTPVQNNEVRPKIALLFLGYVKLI
ncbi:hypothetical protein AVEN_182695-1 [Araneus ventricosus]|uniref:Uncharacterized protein n=1 Tax=Araneus ventricosus TaxID=182803 RepID=A0A4Y2JQY1_ARAVE|nr:hypothetical protein AVEN_182695-1 [Araneus ventricosus]